MNAALNLHVVPPARTPAVIEWKEPPGRGNPRKVRYEAIVTELRAHPGRWARVLTDSYSGATAAFKKRGCETRIVTTAVRNKGGNHLYDIYARWPEDGAS